MQNAKLLIIDDDEDDFLLARDLLDEITRGPYVLDWVSSYERGLELLQENRHDLCLMDYQLGAHDGIELLRQALALGFSGPIILLTGMHHTEVDIRAMEAGAVDYLVKDGLTAEQLARSIRYALGRREMDRERVERLRAESENRSKSEFLAHLSHELRTPLSAILGFTELLINTKPDLDSEGHLNVIHRNGKHLLGLLNDILDLSKIEAGKLELEPQTVYLSSFITDIYFLMHGAAVDKNLHLKIEAPDPLPQKITTDPTRLRQILLNLLGNSIKFTDVGEVTLCVHVVNVEGNTMLEFRVRDTGIGIRAEVQKEIFQPFVQSKSSYSEPRAGTGLGLSISQQLVRRLGGEIILTSTPGEGSEFSFVVDPGDINDVEHARFSLSFDVSNEPQRHAPQLNGRVLVVDDLRDIRQLIGHFVTMTGIDVSYAKNGEEALRLVNNQEAQAEFDIVLMDIHMPVMGGLEAAHKMREQGFTRPLIALTAAHMKGDMDKCLEAGFTAYLSKPVDQNQLHECLLRFLPQPAAEVWHKPILLVEDDADARTALCGLLELMGYQVTMAGTAKEALSLAKECPPAVVLADLNLPDMNGYDLAAELYRLYPKAQIAVISGAEVDSVRAQVSGIKHSLLKPVGLDQLRELLDQL